MEDDIAFEVLCQEGNELLRIQFSLFQDTALSSFFGNAVGKYFFLVII